MAVATAASSGPGPSARGPTPPTAPTPGRSWRTPPRSPTRHPAARTSASGCATTNRTNNRCPRDGHTAAPGATHATITHMVCRPFPDLTVEDGNVILEALQGPSATGIQPGDSRSNPTRGLCRKVPECPPSGDAKWSHAHFRYGRHRPSLRSTPGPRRPHGAGPAHTRGPGSPPTPRLAVPQRVGDPLHADDLAAANQQER